MQVSERQQIRGVGVEAPVVGNKRNPLQGQTAGLPLSVVRLLLWRQTVILLCNVMVRDERKL